MISLKRLLESYDMDKIFTDEFEFDAYLVSYFKSINFKYTDGITEVVVIPEWNELTVSGKKDKTFKLPKKMTINWVFSRIAKTLEEIEKGSKFNNLSKQMSKFVKDSNLNIYPASYGIGICSTYNTFEESKKKLKPITDILDANSVEYSIRFSDAYWVVRLSISKKAENLKKLNNLF